MTQSSRQNPSTPAQPVGQIIPIATIKRDIANLTRMKDLPLERFAEENGYAHSLVKAFGSNGLKATQLRRFFDVIKRVHRLTRRNGQNASLESYRPKLLMLMPTLAYAKARKLIPEDFYIVLRDCMSQTRLQDADDLERVSQFMEAVVAYHKLEGGK